jgi:hypothetical protein
VTRDSTYVAYYDKSTTTTVLCLELRYCVLPIPLDCRHRHHRRHRHRASTLYNMTFIEEDPSTTTTYSTKPPELIASNQYVKENNNNNGNGNGNSLFPSHNTKKVNPTRDIDVLLAKELNQLTLHERDQVYQELHGVGSIVEEDDTTTTNTNELSPWVQQKLIQFDKALYELPSSTTIAYRLAHVQNVTHATDPTFRLQFLRAERFDATTAAARMARYFREKLVLFGPEKIGQARITLKDLNGDDLKVLESGYMQWLPARDRSGRPIYFGPLLLRAFTARETVVRVSK